MALFFMKRITSIFQSAILGVNYKNGSMRQF